MPSKIDLRLQECAVALAEELSFTKAAKRMNMSQSAFSRCIQQTEKITGTALFLRSSRKVALTEAGQRFVEAARQTLHFAHVVALAAKPLEQLVIGYPVHFDVRFVIECGNLTVPGIHLPRFTYRSSSSTRIVTALHSGRLHCGIVAMPYDYPEISSLIFLPLARHHLNLMVPRTHRLFRKRDLQLADLKDEALIFIAKEQNLMLHPWLQARCREAGFSPQIVQEVSHPHDYVAMVSHGLGIGLGFEFSKMCSEVPAHLGLRRFSSPHLSIPTAMIFGDIFRNDPLNRYVQAVAALRDRYAEQIPCLARPA